MARRPTLFVSIDRDKQARANALSCGFLANARYRPGRADGLCKPPQRPDCVAGHVRFEPRNVVANYPFESSRGFPQSEPNSGYADHSRLSCSAGGYAASGLGSAGIFSKRSARTWPSFGVAEKARIGRDLFFRSEDHRLAAKPRICSDAPDTALPPLALAFGLGMGEPANGALACC